MPQTVFQRAFGYAWLVFDTLLQRLINLGAGDRHVLFTAPSKQLSGRVAVVTGANTGLGFETARWLLSAGAHVILACRNPTKAAKAESRLRGLLGPDITVESRSLDLADLSSVRSFADGLIDTPLHMLILNAGIMGVPSTIPEAHLATNHCAHALLLLLLARQLHAHGGRVVVVSSLTAVISDVHWNDLHFQTRPYAWFTAYGNSKLAQILFARALRRRFKQGHCFPVLCVHPGESTTDVARHLGNIWSFLHKNIGRSFLLSPREAARTCVFAATTQPVPNGDTLLHAVNREIQLPERLVNDVDAERMWSITLGMIGVKEEEAMRLLMDRGL